MKFNWIDVIIIVLLSFNFITGVKKNIVKGLINLFIAIILIGFILVCLDSIALPEFLSIRLGESFLAGKFLRLFNFMRVK